MKFRVSRTSVWDDEVSPCPGAVREKCLRVDARTSKSPESHDATMKALGIKEEPWLSRGMNHRKSGGGIERDLDSMDWFVELSDLDALLRFAGKHGDIIIKPYDQWAKGFQSIEIYDGYRE